MDVDGEKEGHLATMKWTIKANMVYQIRQWPLVERCMTPGEEDITARTVQTSLTHLQTTRRGGGNHKMTGGRVSEYARK